MTCVSQPVTQAVDACEDIKWSGNERDWLDLSWCYNLCQLYPVRCESGAIWEGSEQNCKLQEISHRTLHLPSNHAPS